MWKLLLLISIIGLTIGFALGYGARAAISQLRRRKAEGVRMMTSGADGLPRELREALAELSRRSRPQERWPRV
jgi:hypothetical protein